jgi:tetratricopeptide (TPR) repeat protein
MQTDNKKDSELAAALFYLLGEPVPHDPKREREAGQIWDSTDNREQLLLKIIELCGDPTEPMELYLCEKAYSWLGKNYCRQTIQFAKLYLESDGWDALSGKTEMVEGIQVDHGDSRRAGVLVDLAKAQEELGALRESYSNYLQAYELVPYNAMIVIKAAEVLFRFRGRTEALNFLLQQRSSPYYEPIKYRDPTGKIMRNEVFKELLESYILKIQKKGIEK